MDDGAFLLTSPDQLLDLDSTVLVLLCKLFLIGLQLAHPGLDVDDRLVVLGDSVLASAAEYRCFVRLRLRHRVLRRFHAVPHLHTLSFFTN